MSTDMLARVGECLAEVIDPCSAAAGTRLSVLDMGLVRDVAIEDGRVTIRLRLTSPMCTMVPYFIREVEERVVEIPGVTEAVCETDMGLDWDASMMTTRAVERLAARRLGLEQKT